MEPIERFNMDSGIGGISDDPLFQRVWRRVKGEGEAGEGERPPQLPVHWAQGSGAGALFPEEIRETRALSGVEASEEWVGMIRAAIESEVSGWQITRRLVRGAPWGAAEALSTIAADELRHANRLSAALFLLTGIRYLPKEQAAARRFSSRWEGLRLQFERGLTGRQTYGKLSAMSKDPFFQELFQGIAREEEAHVRRIQEILEREFCAGRGGCGAENPFG